QAVLVVQPSDHVVTDLAAFECAVRRACEVAERDGKLVLLGVRPASAQTGYGYIECGESLGDGAGFSVNRFVEKPDVDRATQFMSSGRWLWNVGIFVFTAQAILSELERFKPDILRGCRLALAQSAASGSTVRLDREAFGGIESISIDHAVMEKSNKLAVVPLACDWTDVGSWASLWEIQDKDAQGNVLLGDVVSMDT